MSGVKKQSSFGFLTFENVEFGSLLVSFILHEHRYEIYSFQVITYKNKDKGFAVDTLIGYIRTLFESHIALWETPHALLTFLQVWMGWHSFTR